MPFIKTDHHIPSAQNFRLALCYQHKYMFDRRVFYMILLDYCKKQHKLMV